MYVLYLSDLYNYGYRRKEQKNKDLVSLPVE